MADMKLIQGGGEPPVAGGDDPPDLMPTVDMLHQDNGYASRKLWVTIGAALLVGVLYLLSGLKVFAAAAPNFMAAVGAIVGLVAAYITGNTMTKFAAAGVHKAEVAAAALHPLDPEGS